MESSQTETRNAVGLAIREHYQKFNVIDSKRYYVELLCFRLPGNCNVTGMRHLGSGEKY